MKTIDLSHPFNTGTPVYPGDIPTQLEQFRFAEKDGFNAWDLHTSLHTGTHIDMPLHFLPESPFAGQYTLENFYGKGVLLDVRGEAVITMKEEYREQVGKGDVVLLYSGYDRHYQQPDVYFLSHPVLSVELAEFFVSSKIKILGMDIPSPDTKPHNVHKTLFAGGIFLLENVCNLQSLLAVPCFDVWALPLKIEAEASPVRAVAVLQ